jgi:hypothetical protein
MAERFQWILVRRQPWSKTSNNAHQPTAAAPIPPAFHSRTSRVAHPPVVKPLAHVMSWDISIQDLPANAATVADIPDDFKPRLLGPRSDVIARVREILPDANFRDPSWGILEGGDFSIEFNMGSEEICDGFMLHIRGGGGIAMTVVAKLLEHLKLRGIDCQTGDFFRHDAAEDSFRQWQAYRDRVVHRKDSDEGSSSGA